MHYNNPRAIWSLLWPAPALCCRAPSPASLVGHRPHSPRARLKLRHTESHVLMSVMEHALRPGMLRVYLAGLQIAAIKACIRAHPCCHLGKVCAKSVAKLHDLPPFFFFLAPCTPVAQIVLQHVGRCPIPQCQTAAPLHSGTASRCTQALGLSNHVYRSLGSTT